MANRAVNNVKLGLFVLAGLFFLVLLLYMIGKNRNMFGSNYILKARFENVHGLVTGNNVRFSGIEAGTVKQVKIINDTVIEVTMLISSNMKNIIRKDAIVSIGTDGLVGNKVVNIAPSRRPSALASNGDLLVSKKAVDTDEMLQTLYDTNNDVASIATELKTTVQRFNSHNALWSVLSDESLPIDLRMTIKKIKLAATNVDNATAGLDILVDDIRNGKGTLGSLLSDSSLAENLNDAVLSIKAAGNATDSIAKEIRTMINGISEDINAGQGTLNALLKDSIVANRVRQSLNNINRGTENFNQNMEALKHNILFRGYFRKMEKRQKREQRPAD